MHVVATKEVAQFNGGTNNWYLAFPDTSLFKESAVMSALGLTTNYEFTAAASPNATIPNEFDNENIAGRDVYKFPIHFKVTDKAGNESADAVYYLWIYPDGDRPKVAITNPDPNSGPGDRLMGGQITIHGTAEDNDYIWDVIYRVLDSGGSPVQLKTPGGILRTDEVTYAADGINITAAERWYRTDNGHASPSLTWSTAINVAGELNPPVGETQARYTIQVRAFDARQIDGAYPAWDGAPATRRLMSHESPPVQVEVFFENGMPVFANEKILARENSEATNWDSKARLLSEGATASKTSSYKTVIRDEGGLKKIEWQQQGSASWEFLMDATDLTNTTKEEFDAQKTAYVTNLAKLADNSTANADNKIAARVMPRGFTRTFVAGKRYLIWDRLDGAAGLSAANYSALGLRFDDTDPDNVVDDNKRFTAFKPTSTVTVTTGWAIEAVNSDGGPYVDDEHAYYEWEVVIDVNTEKIWTDKDNGNYNVFLRATDIASPNNFVANKVVQLDIDNFYPMGMYTGNAYAAGSSYTVQGTANDTTTGRAVGGIQKVVLWFEKGGTKYGLGGAVLTNGASVSAAPARYTLNGLANPNVPTLSTVTMPASGYVTIDKDDPLGAQGPVMGFGQNGTGKDWYVKVNASSLATSNGGTVFSGPVTLKYLVYDNAENVSVYEQTLLFREGAPVITSVTLGTDLRDDTALQVTSTPPTLAGIKAKFPDGWTDSRMGISPKYTVSTGLDANTGVEGPVKLPNRLSAANFSVRNKLLVFQVATTRGVATNRHYQVYYVNGSTPNQAASGLTKGSIYTLTSAAGETNWDAVGAPPGWRDSLTADPQTSTAFIAAGTTPYGTGTAHLLSAGPMKTKDGVATAEFAFQNDDFGGTGEIGDTGEARFVIKVWDGDIVNGQSDFIILNVPLKNTDTTLPTEVKIHDLNPNTEGAETAMTLAQAATPEGIGLNRSRGGLYNFDTENASLKRSGYIQPRNGGFTAAELGITDTSGLPTNAWVSGTVILRGLVEDDTRINEVTVTIGSTPVKILEPTDAAAKANATAVNTGLLQVPSLQAGKVYFADYVDLNKHQVEWAYVWDTQQLPDATNTIGNTSYQAKATAIAVSGETDSGAAVTVVRQPYVTGILRNGNSSWSTGRSVQGWYGFTRGEENMAFTGFNFGTGAPKIGIAASTATISGTAAKDAPTVTTRPAGYTAAFTIPTTAQSGNIVFQTATNNTYAVNAGTSAHTIYPWNQEQSVAEGTELWDDHIHAHVWQSDDNGNFTTTTEVPLEYPSMSIIPGNGNLVGVYAYDVNNGYAKKTTNYDGTNESLLYWVDPVIETDTHYNNGQQYTVYNVQGRYSTGTSWDAYGGIYIKANGGGNTALTGGGADDNHYLVEKTHYNLITDQFANPHIVTYNDSGTMRMHVSYYDAKDGSMKYRLHTQGIPGPMNNTAWKVWVNLDGGSDAQDADVTTVNQTINGTTGRTMNARVFKHQYKNVGDTVSAGTPLLRFGTEEFSINATNNYSDDTPNTGYRYLKENLVAVDEYVSAGTAVARYGNSDGSVTYQLIAPISGYIRSLLVPAPNTQPSGTATIFTMDYDLAADVGGMIAHLTTSGTPSGTATVITITSVSRVVAGTRTGNAGFHNAIDVTSDGRPAVVYQDQTNGTLKLAHSSSKTPDKASDWQTANIFGPSDNNRTNVGDYVSFRIDSTGKYHIAAVRGVDLVYISGTPSGTSFTISENLVVDSPGRVGKWVDLSLDSDKPYITYLTAAGNYGGARMVFKDPVKFTKPLSDQNGESIKGWEAMNIPTRFRVENHRLSIEKNPSPGGSGFPGWTAAVGYIGEQKFRAAYYMKY
jgi:hypothetical protein